MSNLLLLSITVSVALAYDVAYQDVTPGGYVCGNTGGGGQAARVYYPKATGKVPVISFAHGFAATGAACWKNFEPMLKAVAASGYVVIISESSSFPRECADAWKDQIHSLAWIKDSKFANLIDFGKKKGIMGHSMGGGATYHSAGQSSAVQGQNVGAAVALHPQIQGPGTPPYLPITNSLVPIFFGTGSADTIVSPLSVKNAYSDTKNVSKVFSEISGAGHLEPSTGFPNRHTPYVIAMFDCHLLGNESQCDKVYGKGEDALCGGKVKMTDCEHERVTLEAEPVVV